MKKIPTLFVRAEQDRYVTDRVTPGCEWVLAGEGTPTRKYDGTCVLISIRGLYARREVKPGKQPPNGFIQEGYDEATGKTVGWEPIEQSPFRKPFMEAYEREPGWKIGTYELCGPKINGNPEGFDHHELILHRDAEVFGNAPRDFAGLCDYMTNLGGYEGVVWHHPDGRMAKLKARDIRLIRHAECDCRCGDVLESFGEDLVTVCDQPKGHPDPHSYSHPSGVGSSTWWSNDMLRRDYRSESGNR